MRKHGLVLKSLVLAIATILLVAPAFAAPRRALTVSDRIVVQGEEIPAGNYSLRWAPNGAADSYSVTVVSGKQVLATATGRTVKLDKTPMDDSLVYQPDKDGAMRLVEIRFGGKPEAIRIEAPAAKASMQ